MKKCSVIFVIYLFYSIQCLQGQYEGIRIILSTDGLADATYHRYEPPFKAKMIYEDTIQAVNEYPEQLMSSIVSAKTEAWVGYNTLGGSEKSRPKREGYFEIVNNATSDSAQYQELISKMEFIANGEQMAVIKFYLHREDKDKVLGGVMVMSKEQGTWKKTSTPYTTDIAMCMLFFKTAVLERLMFGNPQPGKEQDIYDEVVSPQGISFKKLWREQQDFSEDEYYEFCEELNW